MDFFEAQDFFKKMHQGKDVTFEFDSNCMRKIEIIKTDGKVNPIHHIEYRYVKVSVDGANPQYAPIQPHRECWTWDKLKQHLETLMKN